MENNAEDHTIVIAHSNEIVDLVEDGEVLEESTADTADMNNEVSAKSIIDYARPQEPLFEVRFSEKAQFKILGYRLLQAINNELNPNSNHKQYKIEIVEDDIDGSTYIRAHAEDKPKIEEEVVNIASPSPPPPSHSPIESVLKSPTDFGDELRYLFTVDAQPSSKIDTVRVPSYKRAVKEILDEISPDSKNKKQEKEEDPFKCVRSRPFSSCFNCGETGHSLRDCPKPRNTQRINRAKIKMKMYCKQDRYHVDVDQRFAHLRPGVITQKLRDAMELRDGELPFFFYRMRTLGYPPGWLEDAKVEQSGLYLIDADSKIDLEASESQGPFQYDASKIHDFPGFNCSPGPKFFDDYKYHRVNRLNKKDFKDEFIKSLGAANMSQSYRRRKMKDSSLKPEENIVIAADMDIENDEAAEEHSNEPFSSSTVPSSSKRQTPQSSESLAGGSRSQSPSLEDLEAKQRCLMEALETNVSVDETAFEQTTEEVAVVVEEDDEEGELEEDEPNEMDHQSEVVDADEQNNEKSTSLILPEEATESSSPKSPVRSKNDGIKDTLMGTPLLKFSPFEKLPDGDNFKSGVSDVINFENLPDSTGKYEQMRGVIKRVRKIINQLNEDAE